VNHMSVNTHPNHVTSIENQKNVQIQKVNNLLIYKKI
jgi:hypothetical protein